MTKLWSLINILAHWLNLNQLSTQTIFMEVIQTSFEGLVELIPHVYEDSRGWFYEFYKENTFKDLNIKYSFPQENISYSRKGVVRGMHLQLPPFEQAKLVTVLSGKVLDVVADLRKGSATFGQTYSCVLDARQHKALLVPEGFAHGFAALEDSVFFYKSSNIYDKGSELGIRWDDPDLDIDWPVKSPILSERDHNLPSLQELLGKSLISRV